MKTLYIALCATLLLQPGNAAARSSMELADVVKLFLPAAKAAGTTGDWSDGSAKDSAIAWKTNGIADAPAYLRNEGVAFVREGAVTATIDGKPTHLVLAAKAEPGTWNVIMQGSRAGYDRVNLQSDANTEDLGRGLLERRLSKQLPASAVRCTKPHASTGNTVYEVRVPGRKVIWINEDWSCGSGGCSSGLTILLSKEDADKVSCD